MFSPWFLSWWKGTKACWLLCQCMDCHRRSAAVRYSRRSNRLGGASFEYKGGCGFDVRRGTGVGSPCSRWPISRRSVGGFQFRHSSLHESSHRPKPASRYPSLRPFRDWIHPFSVQPVFHCDCLDYGCCPVSAGENAVLLSRRGPRNTSSRNRRSFAGSRLP